jgi:hypothetical protein
VVKLKYANNLMSLRFLDPSIGVKFPEHTIDHKCFMATGLMSLH